MKVNGNPDFFNNGVTGRQTIQNAGGRLRQWLFFFGSNTGIVLDQPESSLRTDNAVAILEQ
jgi:hypothetical protein